MKLKISKHVRIAIVLDIIKAQFFCLKILIYQLEIEKNKVHGHNQLILQHRRETAKPGLWTLDWTMDWTMDWTGKDHYQSITKLILLQTAPNT